MIKAVVWDIGGVLIDNPNIRNFWQKKKSSRKLRNEFGSGKLSKKEFIKRGAELLGMSQKKFLEGYKRAYLSMDLIKEGLDAYKKTKVNKYILSDTNPIHGDFLKKNFPQIFKKAKKVFLSYEIKLRKDRDKSEPFKFLAKKLKINPEEILFIDDTSENLENAKKAGIKTVLCDNPKELKNKLEKYRIFN